MGWASGRGWGGRDAADSELWFDPSVMLNSYRSREYGAIKARHSIPTRPLGPTLRMLLLSLLRKTL